MQQCVAHGVELIQGTLASGYVSQQCTGEGIAASCGINQVICRVGREGDGAAREIGD